MTTYTLPEVVAELRLDAVMKDPVRWLAKQINAGRIPARKVGRSWLMTRADINAALEVWKAAPAPAPESPRRGLSEGSLRRRL